MDNREHNYAIEVNLVTNCIFIKKEFAVKFGYIQDYDIMFFFNRKEKKVTLKFEKEGGYKITNKNPKTLRMLNKDVVDVFREVFGISEKWNAKDSLAVIIEADEKGRYQIVK